MRLNRLQDSEMAQEMLYLFEKIPSLPIRPTMQLLEAHLPGLMELTKKHAP